MIVSQGGKALHLVNQNQFLDSPEWFGVTTDEFFQVSITALETSTIISWHRDMVKFCLMEEPRLEAIFDHVVGRDVVRKLMQVNNLAEELQQHLDNKDEKCEDSSSGGSDTADEWSADDKKPMISDKMEKTEKTEKMEKSLLGSLMTGEAPHWRLVNIKERSDDLSSDETVV